MRFHLLCAAFCAYGLQDCSSLMVPSVGQSSLLSTTSSGRKSGNSGCHRRLGGGTTRMMVDQEQPQDIVEKIFNVFFGQKEERPADLGRITVKKFPDQYPAEKELQAGPVKGDTKDMAVIRPLLKQTELEFRRLKLAYSASSAGWNPEAFHKGVDKKGPGIVVAKTKGGAIVGGYNPKGWVGYGEFRPGLSAFLFTWKDGDTTKKATKLRKVGGAGLAVWDKPECGPLFGSEGFGVSLQKKSPRQAKCKLGSYYERLPGGGSNIFSERETGIAELVDLKVFVGVYERGEIIPFDDAIPFSIT